MAWKRFLRPPFHPSKPSHKADGTLDVAGNAGSIHKMGAKVQGAEAYNGWTFWYIMRQGKLVVIDELRAVEREEIRLAA